MAQTIGSVGWNSGAYMVRNATTRRSVRLPVEATNNGYYLVFSLCVNTRLERVINVLVQFHEPTVYLEVLGIPRHCAQARPSILEYSGECSRTLEGRGVGRYVSYGGPRRPRVFNFVEMGSSGCFSTRLDSIGSPLGDYEVNHREQRMSTACRVSLYPYDSLVLRVIFSIGTSLQLYPKLRR